MFLLNVIPFFEHLKEMKYRFFLFLFIFLINFLILYFYSIELFYIFCKPLISLNILYKSFIFTNLTDVFLVSIKLSFLINLLFLIPYLFYNIWFIFLQNTISFLNQILLFRFLLFYCFVYLFYFYLFYTYILPIFWLFFLNFEINDLNSVFILSLETKIDEYLNLIILLLILLFSIFFIPFFLIILINLNFINIQFINQYFYLFYLFLLCLLLFFGPPDIISQTISFIFIFFLFEFSRFWIIFYYFYKNIILNLMLIK